MSGHTNSAGSGTGRVGRRIDQASAWVKFNQSTVGDAFNVSSVTDVGTGDFTINFEHLHANNHYGGGGSIGSESAANDDRQYQSYNWDTDRHRFTSNVTSGGNRVDEPFNCACFFSSHENPAVVT